LLTAAAAAAAITPPHYADIDAAAAMPLMLLTPMPFIFS